jgi:hypothetical protein
LNHARQDTEALARKKAPEPRTIGGLPCLICLEGLLCEQYSLKITEKGISLV